MKKVKVLVSRDKVIVRKGITTEQEDLLRLLRSHGTPKNPSKHPWGEPCKNAFKRLTGKQFSEKTAKEAWKRVSKLVD